MQNEEQDLDQTQELEVVEVQEEQDPLEEDLDLLQEKQFVIINNIQNPNADLPEVDTITLYGDITEDKASDVVSGLLFLEKNIFVQVMFQNFFF